MGRVSFDQEHLSKSGNEQSLTYSEVEHNGHECYKVENQFYVCIV